jgi:hypothetical protein
VFENRVLRGMFGLKREEVTGGWRNCIMWNFIIWTPPNIIMVSKSRRLREEHMKLW